MTLDIGTTTAGETFTLPLDAVTQTVVVYGGKGMGKTNFGSVFAEELYGASLRFSVIDPMGVWWGLQHGTERGEPGLEVLILGGVHGDLPIEPTAGEVVADLVADEGISVVIDISRRADGKAWTKGEKVRFVTAYMLRLYERQVEHRRPLMQIIDEAARYAPQGLRSGDVDESKCLGAIAMVCEEGRNLGIGLTLLTQRSARLNKDVAELADVLVAFRTVGPNSVGAITDWLGDHVARERHKEIVEQLRKLPVGSALVISPGWLEFEGVVPIRARETFDSSKTPRAGETLAAPGKATKPDLDKYRDRMAATIEQAKANDPKELKRQKADLEKRIAELERELREQQPRIERVEVQVLPSDLASRLLAATNDLHGLGRSVMDWAAVLADQVQAASRPVPETKNQEARIENREPRSENQKPKITEVQPPVDDPPGDRLPAPQQRILDSLMAFEQLGLGQVARHHVAIWSDASPKSGGYKNNLGALRSRGLIDYPTSGRLALTEAGRQRARPTAPIRSVEELHEAWIAWLSGSQGDILRVLIREHPRSLDRDELAESVGVSSTSGGYKNNLGALRSLGLIDYPQPGRVVATALLFPQGRG